MQKLILIVAILLFIGCNEEKVSFINIENNINNIQTLNVEEKKIAQSYIKNAKNNHYKLITAEELKNKIDNNENIQIIAVMPNGNYILGFIKGAKNFEFNAIFSGNWNNDTNNQKEKFIKSLGNKEKEIIFYDNNDDKANTAAIWAKKLGYQNVSILIGGFTNWRERNYEINSGMPECCKM